ncbi:MAG: AbrB/MazE/SpoVT family DNA-binding domain-containing protein [Euryarchaeota archaeon]|nr:AbrB/MazE/SpoVT family DNA-binding domain-containing protein [Euryarchaeota archaeon]
MADVVTVDRAGRFVIPKTMREELGVEEGTKFLIAAARDGRLVLQKLDPKELAARLEEELKGIDIEAVVERVRREINEKARKRYPDLFD